MSPDIQADAYAALMKLRQQLDTAFNPIAGERKVTFTLIFAETAKVEQGKHFATSHISNADGFEDQIAMAKAFVTKCEDFLADEKGEGL